MPDQDALFEFPPPDPEAAPNAPRQEPPAEPKLKVVDRRQMVWIDLEVDTLVSRDHLVRAIWDLVGKLDLRPFLATVKSKKGCAGRDVQITTDARQKVIVAAEVNQCSSDADVDLREVVGAVEANLHRAPEQMVTDGGFTGSENIINMDRDGIDLIGPLPDTQARQAAARKASGIAEEFAAERFEKTAEGLLCPAGQLLTYIRAAEKRENRYAVYQAPAGVCSQCEFHLKCCPKGFQKGRSVSLLVEEAREVAAFKAKMATEAAKQVYKRRSEVAETPNAWIKEKFGLRKFRLRGLRKVRLETIWACLTYNVMAWVRLVWRRSLEVCPQLT